MNILKKSNSNIFNMRENSLIKVDIKLFILDNNKRPTSRSIKTSIPITKKGHYLPFLLSL
ncbi:hypothetical protein UPA6_A0394 [Ureaplasma parvum serovar 6 str. ATCC 27818]|nr:hypothetical protein UPA6_A0394 [Ureaplasma parvum serovar 6 str. ATCC 27818]